MYAICVRIFNIIKRRLSSDCTNINILASVCFPTSLCYFEKKTNTTFLNCVLECHSYRKEQTNLTCEVNVMNFRKPKHIYSELNKICYIIPDKNVT